MSIPHNNAELFSKTGLVYTKGLDLLADARASIDAAQAAAIASGVATGSGCPAAERGNATGPGRAAVLGRRAAREDARPPKPSGVPWLGDIPDDWNVGLLNSLYFLRNEKVSDKDYPPLSVTMGGIVPQMESVAKTEDGDNRKLVKKGDFVINSRSDRRGACGIAPQDGSVSLINIVLVPQTDMHAGFYSWLFHSASFADEFYKWGHGIVDDLWTTRWSEMKKIAVPLPPLPEQRAIAAFLDEKCASIDAIVEEAKAGIAEYAEWKRSIIFHAVTKGIPEDAGQPGGRPSPAAAARGDATGFGRAAVPGRRAARGDARPPRDSGEKWIGQIPAHWFVLPLKTHADMLTPMRDRPEHLDGPIPWVRIEDFDGKYISASKDGLGVSESTIQEMNLKVYPVGTVLCTSSCDLGKCAIVATPLVSNQRFIGIIPKPGLLADFLYYLMLSNAERLNMLSTGTIQANLSRVEFEHLRVQIPPLPEQRAIAAWLDEKCAAIDALVEEKKKLIEDLGAYKKSLIYETVTGKRRVS
jgi:type I restriction enzyme S subunit